MPVSGGVHERSFLTSCGKRDSCKRKVSARMYLLLGDRCSFYSLSDQSGIQMFVAFLFTDQSEHRKCDGMAS